MGAAKMKDEREVHATALSCDQADIRGSVFLRRRAGTVGEDGRFHALGDVRFLSARIGGVFDCGGGQFEITEGDSALYLDGAEIKGDVLLNDGFSAKGAVRLLTSVISGNLYCDAGRFVGAIRKAKDGKEIKTKDGREIHATALASNQADIRGSVFLRQKAGTVGADDQFHALGDVRFDSARIGGVVDCSGGQFEAPDGEGALVLDGAQIGGDVRLNVGFSASGAVRLRMSTISGNFSCTRGRFDSGAGANALMFDGCQIKGSVYLNRGFNAKGTVSLTTSTISGNLDCEAGRFVGAAETKDGKKIHTRALVGDQADIGGSVFLRRKADTAGDDDRFDVLGDVRFLSARIRGLVDCRGGQFQGSEDHGAFLLDGTEITGDVRLNGGFSASGLVRFAGTSIGGNLDCTDGSFSGRNSYALDMSQARVNGSFFWYNVTSTSGQISLLATHVRTLFYDKRSWTAEAGTLILDGFHYDRIIGVARIGENKQVVEAAIDAELLEAWLANQRQEDLVQDFRPQPWEHLIRVLRQMGHDGAARSIAIAKQRRLKARLRASARDRLNELRALLRNRGMNTGRQIFHACARWLMASGRVIWRWLYGVSCAYGYRPTRLIFWAICFAVLFCGVFKWAAAEGVMAPTDQRVLEKIDRCGPEKGVNWTRCPALLDHGYPPFDPVIYSFDLIAPVISTEQTKRWAPSTTKQGHRYWRTGLVFWTLARVANLLGWIFGLMFVAHVSGLVKKD